jgi:hypothetical protein
MSQYTAWHRGRILYLPAIVFYPGVVGPEVLPIIEVRGLNWQGWITEGFLVLVKELAFVRETGRILSKQVV